MPPMKYAREEVPGEVDKLREWLKTTYNAELPQPETWRADVRTRVVPGKAHTAKDTFFTSPLVGKQLPSKIAVARWLGVEASKEVKLRRKSGGDGAEEDGGGDSDGGDGDGDGGDGAGGEGGEEQGGVVAKVARAPRKRVSRPSKKAVEAADDEAFIMAPDVLGGAQGGEHLDVAPDGSALPAQPKPKRPRVKKRPAAVAQEAGDGGAPGEEGVCIDDGDLGLEGVEKPKKKRIKKDPAEPKPPKPPKEPKAKPKGILQSPDEDEIILPESGDLNSAPRPLSVVPQFKRPTVAPRPKPPNGGGAVAGVVGEGAKATVAPHCCTLSCPLHCPGWVGLSNLVRQSSAARPLSVA